MRRRAKLYDMEKIRKIFRSIEEKEVSITAFLGVFCGVVFTRVLIEQFIALSSPISPFELVIEFIHNLFFFSITFILISFFLSWFLKENVVKFSGLFLWASLLIIFPPVFDMIRTGGEVFWSFYLISSVADLRMQFLTFFGHMPTGILYFGTRIVFTLAILLIGLFLLYKTKSLIKSAIGAVGVYIILFVMGAFPSIFVFIYEFFLGKGKISRIRSFNVAQFWGTPQRIWSIDSLGIKYAFAYKLDLVFYIFLLFLLAVIFYQISRKKFWAVLANFRYPQLIYHSGLFLIGMGLGLLNYPNNFQIDLFSVFSVFVLLSSVFLAWKTSVIVNDIYDFKIDEISNPNRPLPQKVFTVSQYGQLGILCFFLSLLGGITVGFPFFFLLLGYQTLAWFYSAPPLRLKKFPAVATFVSAVASIFILFMGYILISPDQSIHSLSWRIILLLLISYTISIPIKDLKDIEGDKKYGIWTIPVILGEDRGRLVIAVGMFTSYILSVFFLNELKLFFWALLFGAVTFLIVVSKKIKPTRVFWWVLGAVSVYLLILVKIVFVNNIGAWIKL